MKETMFLVFITSYNASGASINETEAYRAMSLAAYHQSGTKEAIERYTEKQLKRVDPVTKEVAGNILIMLRILNDKKFTLSWSF